MGANYMLYDGMTSAVGTLVLSKVGASKVGNGEGTLKVGIGEGTLEMGIGEGTLKGG